MDGIGPRLTNSANMTRAEDWALAKFRALRPQQRPPRGVRLRPRLGPRRISSVAHGRAARDQADRDPGRLDAADQRRAPRADRRRADRQGRAFRRLSRQARRQDRARRRCRATSDEPKEAAVPAPDRQGNRRSRTTISLPTLRSRRARSPPQALQVRAAARRVPAERRRGRLGAQDATATASWCRARAIPTSSANTPQAAGGRARRRGLSPPRPPRQDRARRRCSS